MFTSIANAALLSNVHPIFAALAAWIALNERITSRFAVGTGGVMVFHPTRCAKRSLRPVIRLVRQKKLRVRTVRQFIEDKYGWPLESLAEWGPKLVDRPSTASR